MKTGLNKVALNLAPLNNIAEETNAQPTNNEPPVANEAEKEPFHFSLDDFHLVNDGNIHFKDMSVSPIYQRNFTLSQLQFGPIDSNQPDQESKLSVRGKSNEYAHIKLDAIAKPFIEKPLYSLKGTLNEFSLPAVSSYIKEALQYEIKSGQLNVSLDAQLSGNDISGETNILLRGLDFTAADDQEANSLKDQTAIPFSVALGMLKDGDGNVELNVPLSGSTDDPSFGFSGFITLLVKQATMMAAKDYLMTTFVPYAKVISIAMSAGEQLLKVRFNDLTYTPTQIDLSAEQKNFAKQFSLLLKDKPDTQITICPIATAADINMTAGTEVTKKDDLQQLNDISISRFHHFKQYVIEHYQLDSSRLLLCTPQIDSSKEAKPRITFSS